MQPQAKFAGVCLARPLSEELWVVDGGQSWGRGAAFPLQGILLDAQNLPRQAPTRIQALGQYTNTQERVALSKPSMDLLTTVLASGLLSRDANPPPIYS